jgi:uncharacterized sulfatase
MIRILSLALFLLSIQIAAGAKPNIIVILTDDHGWPDLGAVGEYDDLKTPYLDALAASGVRATNGYVTAPQCVPSRAGLLTGKAQNRFGVESNGLPLDGFNAEQTIAERLKKAGYATGQIGKWHLGPTNAITDHGFDDVYAKHVNRPCQANYTLQGETIEMQMVDDEMYHLDACSTAALTFIRRHEKKPFFLYLAYRAPHVPLDAPQKYLSRFPGKMPERRRQALAMISAMDDGVGAIVKELKARNLTGKTLLFFIGDNGAPLKIHKHDAPGGGPGWDGSLNEPMNGEKGMLTEGGLRVPFVVSWPGTIPAGQIYDHPLSSLDVAATAVSLAGLPRDPALDGVDLVPSLSGKTTGAPHKFLTWRWIAQSAIREGNWKLLRGGQREYLFDLDADPEEKKNLAADNPEIVKRLRAQLESWAGELEPPGLATKDMSETWERYYDFYLDGKPAPPLRKPAKRSGKETSFEGWVARKASLAIREGALRITPSSQKGPVLVLSKLQWPGEFTAKVQLLTEEGGSIGVAWRLEGQKDFIPKQGARVEIKGSIEWQEVSMVAPAKGKTIHLRLLLPPGASAVKSIRLERGKRSQEWRFQESERSK